MWIPTYQVAAKTFPTLLLDFLASRGHMRLVLLLLVPPTLVVSILGALPVVTMVAQVVTAQDQLDLLDHLAMVEDIMVDLPTAEDLIVDQALDQDLMDN
jgi:hypothetical protein